MSTLANKNAVIYGGGGNIGGAVARVFAREGATVHLVGRTKDTLDAVADDIRAAGGQAEVTVLDGLDETAIDQHAQDVVDRFGSLDISFNLVPRGDAQGTPLVDMTTEKFTHAITTGVTTTFLTARAAARHMIKQGSGVILSLTSGSSRATSPGMGNTGPADAAVETFLRYLAAETGPHGVRVVGIHTAAVHGTLTRENIAKVDGVGADPEEIDRMISQMALLRRSPRLEQVAETAAFLASDRAGAITSSITNVSSGLIVG
jgi:NAD(P)-dependent dehydrogenase (short-subunit alcohol dehydrogenase family)